MRASDFTKYLMEQVNNNSLYVWGGQGEPMNRMTFETIDEMETSSKNVATILETYAKKLRDGINMSKAKAYDCSGLGVAFLISNDIIRSDMTADGLFRLCKPVDLKEAKEGDFVVKNKTDKGTWGHIGYVVRVGGKLMVVEAKGRAYGVVTSSLFGWKACGRPSWWDKDYYFSRVLKKGCTGNDVKDLQELLVAKGYKLTINGSFDTKTQEAVKNFQKTNGLDVDGVAGKQTISTLGGIYD